MSSPQTNDTFTTEDLILYSFGLAFTILMAVFIFSSQERIEGGLKEFSASARTQITQTSDPLLAANLLRYDYATTVMPTIAARANISIMVGALLALMGSFLIVRGVRESPVDASIDSGKRFQIKFAASSPGLILALLGCLIIGVTIWKGTKVTVDEGSSGRIGSPMAEDPASELRETLRLLREAK